ncbi:uncharacterized protein LAESUDRAFT_722428 [Laetiporus sulphureus 93-53]|uniref:Hamartin-domain-containing protein n=1 Tax=Laetiporus sulphureus 93-53 TaxID=1314785 RepID=A0A165FVG9_9APHY|nr:uncharacterized protein LAESUDRAFT_722428 [Laetiporus sulphureus 93-53]KZT09463.1 hypothetical protein LAESUDRAFT_722428 [Laetiporus sulphureus 93-53]
MASDAASHLSRPLRLLLESAPEAPSAETILALADSLVLEFSTSSSPGALLSALEEELEEIYDQVIDHATPNQAEVFLAVLYHLHPILPPASIISTWFDLILRPALREPKLPTPSVEHAKQLILTALDPDSRAIAVADDASDEERESERARQREKIGEFRRRLMDLYLLDALNESSGEDVLEWAALDTDQREKKACWKANLEDILVRVGLERPQDFLTVVYHCFYSPNTRLQLFILLNRYTSRPEFQDVSSVFASHMLMTNIIHCLIFDGSSTVAIHGLTVLTKLLPIFAVKACEDLKRLLPMLYVVLARIICWRERENPLPSQASNSNAIADSDAENNDEQGLPETVYALPMREDLDWRRLEQTFHGGASSPPSAADYFRFLYYLFPCNTIRFLRFPVQYLTGREIDNPYAIPWEEALDEEKIRSKSEPLMRGHILHPLLIWRGPEEELARPDFWAQYDIARIVGDCTMLDVRNAALGMQQRAPALLSTDLGSSSSLVSMPVAVAHTPSLPTSIEPSRVSSPTIIPGDRIALPARPRVSLQDMIATSVALKSGLDVEMVDPSPSWSMLLSSRPPTRSPSMDAVPQEHAEGGERARRGSRESHQEWGGQHVPMQIGQALAGLQREVLLLRNELNFELWNARENVKHIGRLYEDRVLSKTAELERQGLHNRLREYKAQMTHLQRALKEHKSQALTVKNQYVDWNRKLQDKVAEFKNKVKSLESEMNAMRAADKDAKEKYAAQDRLVAESAQKAFELQTKIKESKPKVDRLHDYEKQIEQLIKLQRLWEIDINKLKEQTECLQVFTSKYHKMELRLDTYEKTHAEMNEMMRSYRQRVHTLETQLSFAHRQQDSTRKTIALANMSSAGAEVSRLKQANQRLRDDNAELREEIEEVKAMVELLKHQVSEQRRVSMNMGRRHSRSVSGMQEQGTESDAAST